MQNIINIQDIKTGLSSEFKNLPITILEETDSTNNVARKCIMEKESTGLILARHQTNGRGRNGHSFFSPKDSGIYMSYFYTPENGLVGAEKVTTKAAVSVSEALEYLYGETFNIKWVNDIYYQKKKVAGILTEAITCGVNKGSVIVGIGINYSEASLPSDIRDIATFLPNKKEISQSTIVSEILNRLIPLINAKDDCYVNQYRSHLLYVGSDVTFMEKENKIKATIIDIDDSCGLIVRLSDNSLRTIKNGEVSLLRPSP